VTDQPTTPRAALLAFADYLTEHDMPAPAPSSVYAQLAREHAERYPAQPSHLEAFRRLSTVEQLDDMRRHLTGQPAPGLLTAELVGTPTLDVDQLLRVEALHAATHWLTEHDAEGGIADVLVTADAFEAWLRGDQ
jgi:hypothetical protein